MPSISKASGMSNLTESTQGMPFKTNQVGKHFADVQLLSEDCEGMEKIIYFTLS